MRIYHGNAPFLFQAGALPNSQPSAPGDSVAADDGNKPTPNSRRSPPLLMLGVAAQSIIVVICRIGVANKSRHMGRDLDCETSVMASTVQLDISQSSISNSDSGITRSRSNGSNVKGFLR